MAAETTDIFYLGYPITLGHGRDGIRAETPDGRVIYEGASMSSARAAIRYDRRGSGSAIDALARAQVAQAERHGYRDAATRYYPEKP